MRWIMTACIMASPSSSVLTGYDVCLTKHKVAGSSPARSTFFYFAMVMVISRASTLGHESQPSSSIAKNEKKKGHSPAHRNMIRRAGSVPPQ